jgi:hypothetical protein
METLNCTALPPAGAFASDGIFYTDLPQATATNSPNPTHQALMNALIIRSGVEAEYTPF